MAKPILYLIDGSSYIFRAYYALRHLSSSKGFPTNAVYGFTSMLFKFLKDYNPEYLGIVFDSKGDVFRNDIYPEYKANRAAPPEDLVPQIGKIFEIVDAFNIARVQLEGFEADDLMGTIAKEVSKDDVDVVLVTGDKDFTQLVTDKVTLLDTMKNKKTSVSDVIEKYGVSPERVVDVFALAGDSVDNIPGVKGIGEKTAVSLISAFGSLDELLEHLDEIPDRQRGLIEEHLDMVLLSKELVTIKTDVDIQTSLDRFKYSGLDDKKVRSLFLELEFRNLLRELGDTDENEPENPGADTVPYDNYHLVLTKSGLKNVISKVKKGGILSIDLETTSPEPMLAHIVGFVLSPSPHEAYYVPVAHRALKDASTKQLGLPYVVSALKPLLEDEKIKKIGQNLKYEIVVLERNGITLSGISFDTMIAAHMIDSSRQSYSLDELSKVYLEHRMISYRDVTGTGKSKIGFDEVELQVARDYACEDSDVALILSSLLSPKLEEYGLTEVFTGTELRFIEVLARIEMNGVRIDADKLGELSKEFSCGLKEIEKEIYSEVGH